MVLAIGTDRRRPDPGTFLDLDTPAPAVDALGDSLRFFHWELEFPDVFTAPDAGFDAIVGNPPWETQKPNSMEFFSNIDPLYRTYDKQQALRRQRELFKSDPQIERDWLDHVGQFAALSNWFLNVAWPFGDGKFTGKGETFNLMDKPGQWRDSDKLHGDWRDLRKDRPTFADPEHPYQHQGGSDINSYKLFLEQAYRLLRPEGRLALLVPSGIYTDKATGDLRKLFLEKGRWTHLYALQNERFVFGEIHHSFKVAIVAVTKGDTPTRSRRASGSAPATLPRPTRSRKTCSLTTASSPQARDHPRISPNSGAILELRDRRDLSILEKMYASGVLLGDQTENGWQLCYAREFDMTNDSKLFPGRGKWEAEGYRPDEYGHWLRGSWRPRTQEPEGLIVSADRGHVINPEDVDGIAVPLLQGAMINIFDFAAKGFDPSAKNSMRWKDLPTVQRQFSPQFVMALSSALREDTIRRDRYRLAFRDIARSTDTRTFIGTLVPHFPCGNTLGVLSTPHHPIALSAILNSAPLDWSLRVRQAGTHLNLHIISELALPLKSKLDALGQVFELLVARISYPHAVFSPQWLDFAPSRFAWRRLWAVTPHERLRLRCILDVVVAHLFGLTPDDFAWILRDCDHPVEHVCNAMFARRFDPRGSGASTRTSRPSFATRSSPRSPSTTSRLAASTPSSPRTTRRAGCSRNSPPRRLPPRPRPARPRRPARRRRPRPALPPVAARAVRRRVLGRVSAPRRADRPDRPAAAPARTRATRRTADRAVRGARPIIGPIGIVARGRVREHRAGPGPAHA
ncbi:Eco57I restriction-modification methylase domain-containing protein [Nannocystis pusilla]|uniref:Eco57I restriction-modification methylase domain-containing protein n=1 Tax=Nannocystis pusilla TaxID=889268 RepID=UPI003B7632B2